MDTSRKISQRRKTPPRTVLRTGHARSNMPLLRKNTERRKQTIRTYENTAAKRRMEHRNMPQVDTRRHTKRQMGQTHPENERNHTGDKTKRMGRKHSEEKIVTMQTKAADRQKEKTAKNTTQQKGMKKNSQKKEKESKQKTIMERTMEKSKRTKRKRRTNGGKILKANRQEENNRQNETSAQEQKLTEKENTFKIILTQPQGNKREEEKLTQMINKKEQSAKHLQIPAAKRSNRNKRSREKTNENNEQEPKGKTAHRNKHAATAR